MFGDGWSILRNIFFAVTSKEMNCSKLEYQSNFKVIIIKMSKRHGTDYSVAS